MRRVSILCALMLITVVLPSPALSAPVELATVHRDTFGVPHIVAPSQHALAYAMGFSLAEDRPFQLDLYRRAGEGRLSEILGEGENREFIDADILMRQEFFERSRIQDEIDVWDQDLRALWEAYASGITAGWAEVIADPSRSPVEFAALGYEPEPWTLIDSAAVALLFTIVDNGGYGGGGELENAVFLGQLQNRFPAAEAEAVWDDTLWINDPDATPVIPDADAPPPPGVLTPPPDTPPASQLAFLDLPLPLAMATAQDDLLRRVVHDLALPKLGSYGVAIAPSQSASGNALLLGAPQSGIAAPPLVWEVGMHAPGIDCAGAAVPGAGPFLVNGTCSHHAWTIVAGVAGDQVDVVIEQLSGSDSYTYDGVAQVFEERTERFLVRNTDPTSETAPEFTTETKTFQRSRHGTVFSTDRPNNVAYVRKRAQEGRVLDNLASLFHLTEAQTIEEANDAVQEASWSVHIPYADAEGNIAYWFTGRNPIHATGLDLRLPTPGHSRDFEWAPEFIPNPHVRNPSQGFLVANQGFDSKPVGWWPASDEWRLGRMERRGVTEEIVRALAKEPLDEIKVDLADIQRVNRLACCDIDPLVGFLADAMREAVELHSTDPEYGRRKAAVDLLDSWAASGFAREDADPVADGFYDAPGLAIWAADDMPRDVYGDTDSLAPGPVWDGMYPLTFQDEVGGRPSIGGSQEQLAPLERWLRHARGLPTGLTPSRDYFDNISTPGIVETWDELLVTALDGGLNVLEARYGTADMSRWTVAVNTIPIRALGALDVRRVKGFDHSSYNFIAEIGTCNGLSILPPGQGAPVSVGDFENYDSDTSNPKSDGSYPPHYVDQLVMYEKWEFKSLRLCRGQFDDPSFPKRELLVAKTAPNRPPNAVEDSAETSQGTSVTIDVLKNDYDPDGDALTISGFTQADNGSVVKNGDDTMTYSPNPNFSGTDRFTYTVCDAGIPTLCDTATVTVRVVAISINDVTVNEGAGTANFTATLSAASAQTVTVDFTTANGTARAGSDYTATGDTLTFAPGQTTKTVSVLILDDALDEANETFTLNLSNPSNAKILDDQGVGTITDDDPGPTISINDVTVNEGAGTANFTVTLSAASGQTVTVDFDTANDTATAGSDYTAVSGTVTFAPGDISEAVSVTILDDALDEVSETFFVNLSNPSNATILDDQGVGTITDDDPGPTISINDVTVNEGAGTANFTVRLSAASAQTVTVDFATANDTATAGSDYTAQPTTTLTYTPGQTTKTVSVTILEDSLDEANETFFVNLSNSSETIADNQGVGTITDNDPSPTISINDVMLNEDAGTANFKATLSAASAQTVTVDFTTANGTARAGSDYTATGDTLTYTPGQTTKTVSVAILEDALDEPNETFFVNLTNETNATITDPQGIGTITDNDPAPTISINNVTVGEGAGTANFTVTLSAASGQTVTVDFATANGTATAGSDYTAAGPTPLTYAPGQTTKTVNVMILEDSLDEANETFFVNLSNETNATITDPQGIGTITDNDPGPTLSINNVTVGEGAGTANFTVTLSAASGQTATVDFATANATATAGSDYTATSGTVTFVPGDTSETVSVTILNDTADEANETFFVNLSNATNATIADGQGLGTIQDNDPPPVAPGSRPAIVRDGVWFLRNTLTTGVADTVFVFGNAPDLPVFGDWDGNGSSTPGVFRSGVWYLDNGYGDGADIIINYGDASFSLPVVGDWNNDGIDTVGLVRDGVWFLRNTNTTGQADSAFAYGNPTGDAPIVGDWDGDGDDTVGIVRNGVWFQNDQNDSSIHENAFGFGNGTDGPLIGDWNADGTDTPGVFRDGVWYTRNSNTGGIADGPVFGYGDGGDRYPRTWNAV